MGKQGRLSQAKLCGIHFLIYQELQPILVGSYRKTLGPQMKVEGTSVLAISNSSSINRFSNFPPVA